MMRIYPQDPSKIKTSLAINELFEILMDFLSSPSRRSIKTTHWYVL